MSLITIDDQLVIQRSNLTQLGLLWIEIKVHYTLVRISFVINKRQILKFMIILLNADKSKMMALTQKQVNFFT